MNLLTYVKILVIFFHFSDQTMPQNKLENLSHT